MSSRIPPRQTTHPALRRPAVALILLAAVVAVCYASALAVPFQFDDDFFIVQNTALREGPTALWQFYPSRFVTFLTLMMNYRMGGFDPAGYHLFNVLVHVGASWAVFWLVYRVFALPELLETVTSPVVERADKRSKRGNERAPSTVASPWAFFVALLTGLIFAAHPVQTQAVTYVWQRGASLAGLTYIVAMAFYVEGLLKIRNGQRSGYFFAASFGAGVVSVFCKESSVTLPIALVLLELFFFVNKPSGLWRSARRLAAFFACGAIVPALTLLGNNRALNRVVSKDTITLAPFVYLINQFNVICTYLRLLVWPSGQNLDYDYPVVHGLFEGTTPFALGLLLLLLVTAAMAYGRKARLLGFGILFFFLALSVESSVVPLEDLIVEHRLYLPTLGFGLAVSGLIVLAANKLARHRTEAFLRRDIIVAVVSVLLCAPYARATVARNRVWMSNETLWRDVVAKSPKKSRGYTNLGNAYLAKEKLDDAIQNLKTAISLSPNDPVTHSDIGLAYKKLGNLALAREHLEKAVALAPREFIPLINLGTVYQDLNQPQQSVTTFEAAIKLSPGHPVPHNNLGSALLQLGRYDEAAKAFKDAIDLEPGNPVFHKHLAVAYQAAGKQSMADDEMRLYRQLGGR